MALFDSGVPYTRLISVSGNMQRYRMMRYVMVLGIILVTIFLYVSYYTTPMSSVDNRYAAYVSQEQRMPPYVHEHSDHNFDSIGGAEGNTSGAGVGVKEPQPPQPQPSQPEETASGPSEATKQQPPSSSKSNISGNNSVDGDSKRASVGTGGTGEIVEVTKELSSRSVAETEVKTNLTSDLEQRAKANVSIVIPKVEIPPKQEVLSKLPIGRNNTKPATLFPVKATSKNKLTGDVYEPGFQDPSPDICPNYGENIRLLALIHSAPSHTEARYAIRQTWGHYGTRRDIAIAFLVGRTSNATWESNLGEEQNMYGDIVRSNSYDSYDNLTLKTIAMLEWTDTYCGQAKFLLKVDDDMFINIPKLLDFTKSHWNDTRHIYGRLAKKWRPIRNRKSKYYVSPALYAPKNFPDFVTGPSYLLTTDMLKEMYEASLTHAFLKLEDVYMTGIVSEMVGVKRKHVNEFLNRRIAFNPCAIRKAISIHMVKGKEQFDLWKKLLDVDLKCK